MLKRIIAILFIFIFTAIGWMILGATISSRTNSTDGRLREGVSSIWGQPQTQHPPQARITLQKQIKNTELVNNKAVTKVETVDYNVLFPVDQSDIHVSFDLDHRQKGLLWYSTYSVDFDGSYKFENSQDTRQLVTFDMAYPAARAIYDDVRLEVDGKPTPFTPYQGGVLANAYVEPHQTVKLRVAYRSHGLDTWTYKMGDDVSQWRDFKLSMHTNFKDIDFPADSLSATHKNETKDGWDLDWRYSNLISGFSIGMVMPQKLQPGPVAAKISFFAPVSLLLFFFVMFMITAIRNIELHPMNYFFLAAAFFAFHLLLAYSVDRISIHAAFLLCSAVSVFLVVSYLRLVVGPRFAMFEAALAQFVYLVLFSYTFFLEGFTGLAITIGCIVTLFIAMQMTGRINWKDRFGPVAPTPPPPPPLSNTRNFATP